jgi:hypothetical protein
MIFNQILIMDRNEIINCLYMAVQLAGDGGPQPFDDEEYEAMYSFLEELTNQ